MNALYNFAVGPLAWIAFTVCIGGMIWRLWSLGRLARQRDASALAYMNWKDSLTSIIRWTLPFSTCGWRENPLLTVANFVLHIGILLYILGRGAFLVAFRLRNNQLRGLTAALISGISGVVVMSYGNEVLGQIPTGAIIYMSMAFIFLSPRFDKELEETELEKHAVPGKNLLALNPRSRTAFPSTLAKE